MPLNSNKLKEDGVYIPGEKEAVSGLLNFEQNDVRKALEKEFPGSTQGFYTGGQPMDWNSIVPVITDESNKDKIIDLLYSLYKVPKGKIYFYGKDKKRVSKDSVGRFDSYIPYKTVDCLLFFVDWKETSNEDLSRYQNYIKKDMKRQGIVWEKELSESLNRSTTEALEAYIYKKFLYNDYGLVKMSDNIAEIIVTPDTFDIAFDFSNPVGTEVEVTEKRIDRVITEMLTEEFFKDLKRTPFFKIVPNGHKWIDNKAFMCLYDIVQYTENK